MFITSVQLWLGLWLSPYIHLLQSFRLFGFGGVFTSRLAGKLLVWLHSQWSELEMQLKSVALWAS